MAQIATETSDSATDQAAEPAVEEPAAQEAARSWWGRLLVTASPRRWPGLVVRRWPRARRIDPVTAVVVAVTAIFALGGIGAPLLGLSVFADPGSLAQYSAYRDVLSGVELQAENQRDITDNVLPTAQLFRDALWRGEFPSWNPYALGGEALGSVPNSGLMSPLSSPYWLLPTWLAPGYVKLLELICAIGGMVLFLRLLTLSHAAAWLGGLVFASSAFMVVWTNWPQTRVAALIPALFWALERLVRRVRVRDVVLVSLPVAGMLLGGFPAVTGYALLTGGAYLLVRLVGSARFERGAGEIPAQLRRAFRGVVAKLAAAGAGVAAGVGLSAFQLVPWASFMQTVFIEGRDQDATEHIPYDALITMIAPFALGTANPRQPPTWFAGLEIIAANSYLGAVALLLVFAALALAGTARRVLPKGVWWLLVGASSLWIVAIYLGGPLLSGLQQTGFLFSANFVGRARSVLGFLLAVLAAVGFEVILRKRRDLVEAARQTVGRQRARRAYGLGVWLFLAGSAISVYVAARSLAATENAGRGKGDPNYVPYLNGQVLIAGLFVLFGAAAIAWLWFGPRHTARQRQLRLAAAVVVPVLVAAQALAWVTSYYPRTSKDDYYPTTPTQEFLAANLGHDRYYGADGAIYGSVDIGIGLRSLHGHGFIETSLAELVEELPGEQFSNPSTAIISAPSDGGAARSAVLDRAAVDFYVAPPEVQPFGPMRTEATQGSAIRLRSGQLLERTVALTGPVRGIGVTPASLGDAVPGDARLSVILRDASGTVVSSGVRTGQDLQVGVPWVVPLAGEALRRGTPLTAQIVIVGVNGLRLTAHGDRPAISIISPAKDGLKLVYANETVIYQRTDALPRARWASAARVVADPKTRLRLLGDDRLPDDLVVLNAPGPKAEGKPADVAWVNDGLTEMTLSVHAQGAGYLVLADAIQNGWKVSVDGQPADLVDADHAFVGVAVPAGEHTVRFWYPSPLLGPGMWITGFTIVTLIGSAFAASWWRRRRVGGSG